MHLASGVVHSGVLDGSRIEEEVKYRTRSNCSRTKLSWFLRFRNSSTNNLIREYLATVLHNC